MDVLSHSFTPDAHTSLTETTSELGHKQYVFSNHLGNVLSVITDQKLPVVDATVVVSYSAVVVTATDYSPFGVGLYGRSWSGEYRYGFNGKEQDHEIKGSGNIYDYGARIHDPRLSRWLVVDAYFKLYPGNSPYTFAMNNPVRLVDSDGNVVTIPDGTGGVITYTPGMSSDVLSKYAQATVNYLNSIANGEKGGPRLDKLTSSEVVYRVEINISESFRNLDKGGRTRYDFNSNEVFLEVAFEENEAFNLAALGDELAHAEQFDDGDLGFFESESHPGFGYSAGYDLDDEMASKRAAFEAIDGAGYKPSDTDPEGKYKSTEMLELISKGEDTEKAINKWARKSGYSTQFDAGGEKTGQSISGKQGIEKLSGREGVQRTVYREDGQTINNE